MINVPPKTDWNRIVKSTFEFISKFNGSITSYHKLPSVFITNKF